MGLARLQDALERLTAAIHDVETEVTAMKAEHDPLASHIFISRRHYRNAKDTKGGKRREINARLSFNTACELGFRFPLASSLVFSAPISRARGRSPHDHRTRRENEVYERAEPSLTIGEFRERLHSGNIYMRKYSVRAY